MARGIADIVEIVVLARPRGRISASGGARISRFSMPVKTFLNCTIPALVNIRVGSLRRH